MTAKELAYKGRNRVDMPILKDLYIFSPEEFNAFCEQLCREKGEFDYKNLLPSPFVPQIQVKMYDLYKILVENCNFPDWGQKGGE